MTDKYINENFNEVVDEYNRVVTAFKEELPIDNAPRLIVERNNFKTELGRKLYDLLVKISDDNSFLYDVFYCVKGDEKKKQLMKYLEEEKRTELDILNTAELIEIGIWGLSEEEIYRKFNSSEISSTLFHCLREIELIIKNNNTDEINYKYIFRIMSLLETDEEKEMLINTIIREIEKREIPFKNFMSLIYLSVQNYYFKKHDK